MPPLSQRLATAFILFAIMLLATLACTSGSTPTPIPTPTFTPAPTNTATPHPSSTPLPTSTAPAKVLTLAVPVRVSHWDVHLTPSPTLAAWGPGIIYSRLMRFRSGPHVPMPSAATECDLCESWEQLDPTTYLFHIRKDVLWQDIPPVSGRPLVAQDIVFSLQRQATPGYPNAPLLNAIKTIRAEDQHTVRITLRSPDADFLIGLASGFSKVVAPEAVSLNGDLKNGPVIGSGPWLWDSTSNGQGYFFKANPAYYESGLPLLDRLNILAIPNQQTRVAAFRLKRLDLIESPPADFKTIRDNHPETSFLLYKEAGAGLELALKTTTPPLDNLQVRQALFSALDTWSAIDQVWGGLGFASQGMPVADPGWLLPEEELRNYLASPSRASDLLAAASQGSAPSFTLTVADYGDPYLEYGQLLAHQMEAVGFQVSINVINPTDYSRETWLDGNYQAFIGPIAPITTPNAYLFSVLHSNGAWNTHQYHDPTLDSLIEEQATTLDPSRRQEIILDIQRRTMENAVRFMPMTRVSTWVWWPQVKGFYPNLTASEYFHLARLTVER